VPSRNSRERYGVLLGIGRDNWGKLTKAIAKELEKTVTLALFLSMSSIYKFDRKTRDYMRL
jgi:hypothetical protein